MFTNELLRMIREAGADATALEHYRNRAERLQAIEGGLGVQYLSGVLRLQSDLAPMWYENETAAQVSERLGLSVSR